MNTKSIPELTAIIHSNDESPQQLAQALNALVQHPDATDTVLEMLDQHPPESPLGVGLHQALVHHGKHPDALCVLLWSHDPQLQRAAITRLVQLHATDAVADLSGLLRVLLCKDTRNTKTIVHLLDALGHLLPTVDTSIPPGVFQAAGDADDRIRSVATGVLRRCDLDSTQSRGQLLLLLQSSCVPVRISTIELLASLPPQQLLPMPLIHLALHDPDELVRWVARYELSRLGIDPDNPVLAKSAA